MNKEDKCHYCDKLAIDTKRVCVDVDVSHDGDDWFQSPIYANVALCEEHLEEIEERLGLFDEHKYEDRG